MTKRRKLPVDAFNYYYSLGPNRSYEKVAQKYGVIKRTVVNYAKKESWQDQIILRDQEISKKLEKETNSVIVSEKAQYRKDIRAQMGILRFQIKRVLDNISSKAEEINLKEIKSPADLKFLIDSYEKLVKIDLQILGETGEESNKPQVHIYIPDNNRDKKTE